MNKNSKWERVPLSVDMVCWNPKIFGEILSSCRTKYASDKYDERSPFPFYGSANFKDLLDFHWDSKVTLAAYLFSEVDYKYYKEVRDPQELKLDKYYISDDISPDLKNVVILSEQQYLGLKKKNPKKIYAILVRKESAYRELGYPNADWWQMMKELKLVGKPEDIEVLFKGD
jgi:hypothetical protein